ncbi:MAG: hypothetical protein NC930_09380, partial [Candidatus Omnitrophica bacterium]|nr:hypothetical protein [Candidatus Omnitrophota bacterium]
ERTKYPVLVVTARANLSDLFKQLNVDGFMTKPFKVDDFIREAGLIISKRFDKTPSGKVSLEHRQKKLLLVENDPKVLGKIINAFLTAGYDVLPANSAVKAIEIALSNLPDIILIDLKIEDLPGDLLACKFRQMSKTMDIPLVLFAAHSDQFNLTVTKEILKKVGLKNIVASNDPEQLLKECSYLLTG